MRHGGFWTFVLLGVLFPGALFGGEAGKVGVVKGVVMVGGRPVADAVVSIEGLPKESLKSRISDVKTKTAIMDQREGKFIPRVLPVVVGTVVEFQNHDKSWHHVFSTSEAKKFDLGLYAPGKSRSVTFDKAGVVRVLCNVHPNMEAFVVVKEHPYYSVPGKKGNYQVSGVPLGKYRLEVWHPDLGVREVSFELAREGEVLAIDVDLKKK